MYNRKEFATLILYWYKTAKKQLKNEKFKKLGYICIGRCESYIDMAHISRKITHDEWRLLTRALNKLW